MSNKKHISLILAIMMVLQLIVPLAPLQAKSSAEEVQRSEGQKNGKRSEVFEFKNTEKESPSWFTTRSRSLFGARDVGLTKSEKVKIETAVKGLDDGTFNWEAFGQNKKFNAWVEVAYVGEKDKQNRPIRQKVSDVFDINKAGIIDTTITVDASKTVDKYYIVTDYDKNPDSFKINAFFQKKTIVSDKGEKLISFQLDVQQIVSTKITYNLIDEYGKAIDLNDAKAEKPEDNDLKGIGKIGNVTTFDLKKEGTEILWKDQKLDEFNLTDSSLKMTLTKDKITSAGIDYKLTSTYDVINGGTVTIKRQKDAVTPKDPRNPGDIPEGYARLNLSADATGAGPTGTFTKDDSTDNRRVVDVRAGKPYTTAQAEVNKVIKPIPLTSENKEDTGKTFKAWAPELSTLGTAADKETKTLNATYKSSDEDIIPYLPGEGVPTQDKNGDPIPTNYLNVTFKSESLTKGKVKIGDKEGETVLAKVKPSIDLSKKAEITTLPETDYGFTKWDPALGIAADKKTYTAYFIKSGDKIKENDPIPKDWFKVTVSQDEDSIKSGTVTKAVYAVKPNDKLGQDKFVDVSKAANNGYKDPAWYVGSEKLEKPYEKEITTSTDFLARATEVEANKFKNNPLKAVDITAYKGDSTDGKFWNKGVATQREDAVLKRLIESANVTDTTNPARTTEKRGTFSGTLKVTFTDGSSLEVQNQKLIVIDTKVDIDYSKDSDKDANAPRHNDEVVKGKIKSDEALEGAKVEILDKDNKVIGITLAKADGSFIAGTRKLQAGETIKVRVTLPKADKASPEVEKTVKLNADRLKDLLPIAKAQKDNFSKKQNAIIKEKLEALGTAITEAEKLVDKKGKAIGEDTAKNQTTIDTAVTNLENALKALTANIPPTISGPKTHEIFVGEALDLEKLVDVTDGDGADDLVAENGSNVKITAEKVEGQAQTPVADLSKINETVGTYKVTYTVKDKAKAEVTHEMTLTVKPRTTSAIEVTKDPTNMSYLITEKNGKAKLDLTGMTLNLVDNLGKKTKVELTDSKVKFKVNGKEIKNGGDLTLADDVHFIEVEYKYGDNTLKAQTKGVLRVGPDYDNDGTDDRTQNFDPKNIEKLEVIKQPQLEYIAKDKSEDSKFKLNLEGMIVRMTDKAGKEKLAVVSDGKFVEYDDITKEIKGLTATPAHGATLTPETSATETGDNGKTVKITGPNNSKAETDKLKVFYDANKDNKPDYGQDQKTPAPSAMARNIGEDPKVTTVEGMATPGAVIKIYKADDTNLANPLTTEPTEVKADASGHYKATLSPMLADKTKIKVTAKLGEMVESDPTEAKVFDDKNDNKQPDRDEGFNIKKVTTIEFVNEPKLTYLVKTDSEEVKFDGKDANGNTIYLKLSYTNGDKTESKIMTLEDLMADKDVTVTPAKDTTTKYSDEYGNNHQAKAEAKLVDKKIVVSLKDKADVKVESGNQFAIEIDADGNKTADRTETTTINSVIARNIGTGNTTPKTPAAFTTIEGVAEPGSTVTIKFTPKAEGGQTAVEVTKTVKANAQTGKYKLELKAGENELTNNILLPADTVVKAQAKFGDKKDSPAIETNVFEDLDADGKADNPNANKTERPSALAYNFKDEAKTTIKGEAEPGAKVIAKVGETKVGEATANSDGKYEISATKDGAKLPKGTKVSVTATLAPKGESPAQETVVYEDLDGDGQPDTSQAFDKTKIRGLEVVASPNKMVYNNKEKLDLTGMKVLLTDQMGNKKIVEFAKFVEYGITVSPLNNIELSDKNVADGGNNGQKIKAEVKVTIGNNQETYSGKTPTALVVNKDQSAQPTDVEAANQGTKTTTTVRGKATPGAKVEVKNANGQLIGTVDQVPDNGEFQVEVTKQDEKAKVTVTATESGKAESAPQEAKVFRDKDGNWKDDKGGKVEIEKPVVDPIKVGDESVKVKTPGEGITKITVKDEHGNTIDVVKDGNDWKVDGKAVEKDGDKLVIPTKDKGLDFGAYEKVEITNHDDEGNEGKIVVATKPANLKPMEKPTIDPISTQSTKITGKSLPGSKVIVYLPGDTDETAKEALVKSDGSYELTLATPLADKSLVKVKATNTQRDGVGEAETKVGLNTKQLEDTKTEADGLINDSKTNNNFDPDNNKYDKNLEDKTKAAQDILDQAKDQDDKNDPTQTKVNTAEKELREAINQKKADDKVKVVEKAVIGGQKPSDNDINEAKEAIDKVTDPTAKKELQDRLDKAKALNELKDAKEELDKKIKEAEDEKKPQEEINKAKDESKNGGDIINNGGDGKTAEEIIKEVEKIKEATKILGQTAIQITIDSAIYNSKNLIFTTNPGRCKVFITIYYADGTEKTIEATTKPAGSGSVLLEKPLQVDDYIEIKATRKLKPTDKPDYLDNSTSTVVY